ncbi:hypothetical protein NGRA_1404 [Nosema granulosis]|uniref:Uncharacterized protein n=1 Tax=Nosema granulosis TaxID=83296 RepID=A0A9P6GYH7_9MICR|nr:hypothetical protein NGRA_1404 [Nosema granulosis]
MLFFVKTAFSLPPILLQQDDEMCGGHVQENKEAFLNGYPNDSRDEIVFGYLNRKQNNNFIPKESHNSRDVSGTSRSSMECSRNRKRHHEGVSAEPLAKIIKKDIYKKPISKANINITDNGLNLKRKISDETDSTPKRLRTYEESTFTNKLEESIRSKQRFNTTEVSKIITKLLNLKNSNSNASSFFNKIIQCCDAVDYRKFLSKVDRDDELTSFIENYKSFMRLEVLHLRPQPNLLTEGHCSFTKLHHLYNITYMGNSNLFRTCCDYTPLHDFNVSKLDRDSYGVFYGDNSRIYSFIFDECVEKSTLLLFIQSQLMSLRFRYEDIPELICLEMMIPNLVEMRTLIKIYFYLKLIEKAKTRIVVFNIVKEIMNLLGRYNIPRSLVEAGHLPIIDLNMKLLCVGFNLLPADERQILSYEIQTNPANIKNIIENNFFEINQIVLKALITKLVYFLEGDVGEIKVLLEKDYNNLDTRRMWDVSVILYSFITGREKDLEFLYTLLLA